MHVLLIPGFWLDASSWEPVLPALRNTGHDLHPLTLPGMASRDAVRAGIGFADWVDAVVREVDGVDGPVALVGHSGGGTIAHAVVDARPDRIARVVYVDAFPLGDGGCINDELPVEDGEVPLPDWGFFDDEDVRDMTPEVRAGFEAIAIPVPAAVASDPVRLHDERRYDVPITIIACAYPSSAFADFIEQGASFTRELAAIREVEWVDLPTGHWPQLTRPVELGDAIARVLARL